MASLTSLLFPVVLFALCATAVIADEEVRQQPAGAPPQPYWPGEMSLTMMGEGFTMALNYSFISQRTSIAYEAFGEKGIFVINCAKNTINSYFRGELGAVCYNEFDGFLPGDDTDIMMPCPLDRSPFEYFIAQGVNFTFAGTVYDMSQSLYSWYRGSDDSTFYWETAEISTYYRTPYAYNDEVYDFYTGPASYVIHYDFQRGNTPQIVNVPKLQCHNQNPPFYPGRANAERPTGKNYRDILQHLPDYVTEVRQGKVQPGGFAAYMRIPE